MGLGTRKIKQEMTGTGGGRWMPRAEAKRIANKARRAIKLWITGELDQCTVPPPGWWCSREAGHGGPCAARPDEDLCD